MVNSRITVSFFSNFIWKMYFNSGEQNWLLSVTLHKDRTGSLRVVMTGICQCEFGLPLCSQLCEQHPAAAGTADPHGLSFVTWLSEI